MSPERDFQKANLTGYAEFWQFYRAGIAGHAPCTVSRKIFTLTLSGESAPQQWHSLYTAGIPAALWQAASLGEGMLGALQILPGTLCLCVRPAAIWRVP